MASSDPKMPGNLKTVFVISPIGKTDADGNDFAKLCLEQIIKPAAKDCGGYAVPERADEHHKPGSVTAKVVTSILDADVCVADLTERNANVMYEVAIAHAADKPVILLQQEAGGPPFDFADERVIHYGLRVDLANAARTELVGHFKAAQDEQEDPRLSATMNPVRVLFGQLKASAVASDPEKAVLAEVQAIRSEVRDLTRLVGRTPRAHLTKSAGLSGEDVHILELTHRLVQRDGLLPPEALERVDAGLRFTTPEVKERLHILLTTLDETRSSELSGTVAHLIFDNVPPA
ncbi:hypothetical protein [Propionicimonas sp.]|uniref:hypothetical protein n=1 Tax=Propionicimonas sp. TaxID=1955623 RepID=UPI001818489E|nr:hypothetical protein [Propionicimonas sp.]MBU3975894.1 hypothetical protein [Actinomycetota bacterium]MBA3019707.1 hypothetical protein [Propionicimonas sp.]MBU3987597.1 hypothetical protein [Actinomycetota bacterium]MBU4006464.1 hypothetical protein [Actinomycetota bacterium]MBU4066648.1 hypothetical protein [Actinomycetota bacterium]